MRTREAIEDDEMNSAFPDTARKRIVIELLLDIRDLLKDPQMEIIDELFTHQTQ